MKAVVAGWFSYANGHATAGDLLVRDLLCDWLDELGIARVTAIAPPFEDGTPLNQLDPADFTHAFFVCGPFGQGELEGDFFHRFGHCRLIGLNLSLDRPPSAWNPFDFLVERDSAEAINPDMVFASRQPLPPVAGICLVEPHPEADVARANAVIARLVARHEAAWITIDTRLDANATGLRTKGEVEAIIARLDVLVTTRLHGLVMALKNGVPAIVIDTVPGGGKIRRQCARIGWDCVFGFDALDDAALDEALRVALSPEGRAAARRCADLARREVLALRDRLGEALAADGVVARNHAARQTPEGRARFDASVPPPPVPWTAPPGLLARLRRRLGL